MIVLVAALIGLLSSVMAIIVGHFLRERTDRRKRVDEAIHRAMLAARDYQYDLEEYGIAFLEIPDTDMQIDAAVLTRFNDADRRAKETEREIRRLGVDLALYTTLHRNNNDVVTGFDVIADEVCGLPVRRKLVEATTESAVQEIIFKYGIVLRVFEEEAIDYRRRHAGVKTNAPNLLIIGSPSASAEERPAENIQGILDRPLPNQDEQARGVDRVDIDEVTTTAEP